MRATSIDPDGLSKLAMGFSNSSPTDIYIQQNKGKRIRISAKSSKSRKSIWLAEHAYGIELTLSGSNISRYKAIVKGVLSRPHDTEYDNGKMAYLNWRGVSPASIKQIVAQMSGL